MPVGNEGGGVVVAAGASAAAQALSGRVVGFLSGNAYAQYRTLHVSQCLPMADGTDPADAAAAFVNPLTALGMVETMRSEGHTALVHTVGASNLGLMLNRICVEDSGSDSSTSSGGPNTSTCSAPRVHPTSSIRVPRRSSMT